MKPRMVHLHCKTVEKLFRLKKKAEIDGAYRVARRIHAVILNHERKTSGDISNILKTPRSRVSDWLKNYEYYGCEGLLEGYRPGRPAQLIEQQVAVVANTLAWKIWQKIPHSLVQIKYVCKYYQWRNKVSYESRKRTAEMLRKKLDGH